jgi:hypothetical protein
VIVTAFVVGIFSFLLKIGFGGFVDKALAHMERQADNLTEQERIRANVTIEAARAAVLEVKAREETRRASIEAGTARQRAKMSFPVFWVLIVFALGPGVLNMMAIAIYNIFFWKNGVWPQGWSIAEFPPQSAVWVDLSIRWLFDPVGFATSVATAAGGAFVMGRKK